MEEETHPSLYDQVLIPVVREVTQWLKSPTERAESTEDTDQKLHV